MFGRGVLEVDLGVGVGCNVYAGVRNYSTYGTFVKCIFISHIFNPEI